MLRPGMIGWEQPLRLVLSKRRWMRRLLDFNLRCMMVFTRNPSRRPVLEKTATLLDAGTAEGFRFSHKFHPANPRIFACLRARDVLATPPHPRLGVWPGPIRAPRST